MGRLDEYVDMTGKSSQIDLNTQNIQQIIDELNRNSDSLDALNKSLAITNKGSVTAPLVGQQYTASVGIGTVIPSSFLAFLSRSDQSYFYSMPYFVTTGVPVSGLQMASLAQLQPGFGGSATTLNFSAFVSSAYASAGAPASVTFYYYLFNQPANPSGQ